MGTRSTIHIYNRYKNNLVNIYTQYDGYYQGVGKEIYEWWKNKENYGNGFTDTAFLFISNYKGNQSYNRYLTNEIDEQEYNYYIYEDFETGEPMFGIKKEVWFKEEQEFGMQHKLYYGTIEEFLEELDKEEM